LSQVSDSKTASRSSKRRQTTPPDRASSPKFLHSSGELSRFGRPRVELWPATDDFSDAKVIKKFGDVPGELSAL
jgi:hypothetical protein